MQPPGQRGKQLMAGSRTVAANTSSSSSSSSSRVQFAQSSCRPHHGEKSGSFGLSWLCRNFPCVQFPVCSVFVQFLVCNVQRACQDLLLGSFVPSVLCNPCPVCAVCYVTGWPLIPRADAVYTIITHMRSARVLHGISCKMVQTCGGQVFLPL